MTAKEKEAVKERKIRKSNELIQKARYKLPLPGQKILLYLISRIKYDDTEFRTEEFVISDFCEICGIEDSGGNYKILKEALSDLLTESARVWIMLPNGLQTPLMWIQKPYIDESSGKLMVTLDNDMRPYLLDLKKNYTQYEMIYTMRFRSKYSFRLYEIAKSYQYHDEHAFTKTYTVDELRSLLDADNYPKYCNFNQRVLKPAVEEINTYTDKNLEIREIKNGRKVERLELTISAKHGEALDAVRALIGARPRRQPATPVDATAPGKRSAAPRQKKPIKENGDSGSASGSGLLDIKLMQSRLGAGTEMI